MRTARWLVDLPTRLHLWSAEHELRRSPAPQGADDHARQHNLDVLRAYRRSRQFPHNTVATRPTPVFIDDEGRRCAVAHLMIESGAVTTARHVAATQNYARVREMNPVSLESWATTSGLTTKELARIQPSYGDEGPTTWVMSTLAWVFVALTTAGGLAALLAAFRVGGKSLRRHAPLIATIAGWILLVASIPVVIEAIDFDIGWMEGTYEDDVEEAHDTLALCAMLVGVTCHLLSRRRRRRDRHAAAGQVSSPR